VKEFDHAVASLDHAVALLILPLYSLTPIHDSIARTTFLVLVSLFTLRCIAFGPQVAAGGSLSVVPTPNPFDADLNRCPLTAACLCLRPRRQRPHQIQVYVDVLLFENVLHMRPKEVMHGTKLGRCFKVSLRV
jgi:hypothetical protein